MLRRRPARRTTLAVLALSAAATCVTPFGPEVWRYAVGLSTNPTIARLISEWQRTSPLTGLGILFYGSVLLAALVVVRAHRRGRTIEPGRLLWILALAAPGGVRGARRRLVGPGGARRPGAARARPRSRCASARPASSRPGSAA